MRNNPGNIIRVPGVERTFHRGKVLLVIVIPVFVSMLAVSAINVALPTIEQGIGASDTDVQWLLAGYALTFGVAQIPSGRIGDALGRSTLFMIGATIFTIASLACGLAMTPLQLNIFRLLQGAGAGIFQPQTIAMIQQFFSGAGRAKAFALFGMAVSASVAVGPLLTGVIISIMGPELGWRAAFIVNFPVGVVGLFLAWRWLPFGIERMRKAGLYHAGRLDLDPIGATLITGAILAIMWPFMARGQHQATWGLVALGIVLLALWVFWEQRYTRSGRQPMVDLALFKFRSFSMGTLISATMFLGVTSMFSTVAIMAQTGMGKSALETGMIGLPNAALSAIMAWLGARYVANNARVQVVWGLGLVLATTVSTSVGAYLVVNHAFSFWWLLLTLSFHGIGMGILGGANQTLALQQVPRSQGGAAGGVKSTAERVTTAIGTAIVTGIFFSVAGGQNWIGGFIASYALISGIVILALVLALLDLRRDGPGLNLP